MYKSATCTILQTMCAGLCVTLLATPVVAVEHGRARDARWHGDIRHFHEHDLARWHGGRWVHDRHAGRTGWWWIVGSTWYWYPAPIYPYPNPYQPPPMAALAPAPDPTPLPHYWYYCENPQGYYPYVPQCAVNWRRVPASPQ